MEYDPFNTEMPQQELGGLGKTGLEDDYVPTSEEKTIVKNVIT
jgi:hypothetical protein